jgi:hypothetical protein
MPSSRSSGENRQLGAECSDLRNARHLAMILAAIVAFWAAGRS